jgi:hypothetical protein
VAEVIEVAGQMRNRDELPPPCEAVRDLLYAQAEGEELTADEVRLLDEHTAQCEECAAERRRAKSFTTDISDLLRTLRPAQDLRDRVLQKIETRASRRHAYLPLAALGLSVVLAVVALTLARREGAATVVARSGSPRLLRFAGGEHRAAPFTETLLNGDRLELRAGDAATVALGEGTVALCGPSLVQIDGEAGSPITLHVLGQTSLSARTGADRLVIRAGQVFARPANAEFEMHVDPAGVCRFESRAGRIYVNTPRGNTTVGTGASMVAMQDGSTQATGARSKE